MVGTVGVTEASGAVDTKPANIIQNSAKHDHGAVLIDNELLFSVSWMMC